MNVGLQLIFSSYGWDDSVTDSMVYDQEIALALLAVPAALAVWQRVRHGGTDWRAPGRARRSASTAVRGLALAVLVLARAGPLRGSHSNRLDVMFVLDASRSVGARAEERALAFFNAARAASRS